MSPERHRPGPCLRKNPRTWPLPLEPGLQGMYSETARAWSKAHASGKRYRRFCATIAAIPYDLRVMRTIAPLTSMSKWNWTFSYELGQKFFCKVLAVYRMIRKCRARAVCGAVLVQTIYCALLQWSLHQKDCALPGVPGSSSGAGHVVARSVDRVTR
jgi:hypothetical protein